VKEVYDDLRERDRVVTLYLLAHDLIRHNVSYINEQIKIGQYRPEDIVSMDETNFDFDQEAGETLANRGHRTIGQAVTGSVNRCTVLLTVTMSGEKLPPNIIFKGKDTRGSRVCKECATTEARNKCG
jgi:hypothetical protein